jgi:hypothetical protein
MIGLVTQQARDAVEKARRDREDGTEYREAGIAASVDGQHEGFSKTVHDAIEGPSHPLQPGELGPEDLQRPYLGSGRAADSPGNSVTSDGQPAARGRHVDFTRSRGVVVPLDPMNPGGIATQAGGIR